MFFFCFIEKNYIINLDIVEKLISLKSFGSVYEVVELSSNKKYTAKYFNGDFKKKLSEEKIQSFLQMKCAYIIQFYDIFNHENTGTKVIIIELYLERSLKDKINFYKKNDYFFSEEVIFIVYSFFILRYSKSKK
jgi:serine/threonine protein kinase